MYDKLLLDVYNLSVKIYKNCLDIRIDYNCILRNYKQFSRYGHLERFREEILCYAVWMK